MSLSKVFLRTMLMLACLSFSGFVVRAQYRAGIQGVVLDSQGDVVEGANVTLMAKETNVSKTTTSDATGVYTFSGIAPGNYSIAVEKTGFKKKVLDDVSIASEQTIAVNIHLEVGEVSESVIVNADTAPAIDTETGNISGTLSSQEIQDLPSFGRDPYQLARLAPGVFGDGATGSGGGGTALPGSNQSSSGSTGSIFMTENQPQIVAGGTRNNGNSYQIDGVEVNSLAWGGSAVITPNEESVKEVQIQSNPYSAENGRNSGAQVLVVSQNGTNNIHGSLFIKIHRPGLDAFQRWNGPFGQPQRDSNRFNQFGGSIGGPIRKNHLFAFFSYESLRNGSVGQGTGWYVTPQLMTELQSTAPIASKYASLPKVGAVFSKINPVTCAQVGLPATQCLTITDGSGNPLGLDVGSPMTGVPVGTQDPTYGQAATPFGIGGGLTPGGVATPDVMNVTTVQPNTQTATQYNGRLDWQVTNKDLIAFSVYWVPNNSTFFNGPARASDLWHSDRLNYAGLLLWQHTFSPTLINEARANATRWYFDEVHSNPQEPFGFPADNINGIGQVGLACCPVFGAPGPGVFYQTTYNFRDTVTKVHRSHSLKFGADVYKEQDNDVTTWGGIPNYQFNNLWTFANDAPISENVNFDPRTGRPTSTYKYIRSNIYAVFVQDDYKLKPNLTINVGLRWEYFGPLHEKNNNLSTVILGSGSSALTGLRVRTGGNLYNSSYHNFGPQIGFAWSPRRAFGHEFNNRLVVRGGAGIAYNRMQEAITLNGRFNPPLVVNLFLTNAANCGTAGHPACNIDYAIADTPHDIYGYPSNQAAIETFSSTTGLPVCAPATCAPVNLTAFDLNLPTPVVDRYSIEGQYDLGHKWVATIGYQGSQSRHFTRQVNNLDWLYGGNLNPAVQGVDYYTNDANGHYNALNLELSHQFSNTYQFDTQYSHSSCMDHGSQDYYADPYPFNVGPSLGHCDFDASNSFKAYGLWTPRIFGGNRDWREKVLGGWQLSGIYTYHTGFPFTPFYGVNVVYPAGSGIGGCSLIYPNSNFCNTEPAAYTGGAGSNYSNATFKKAYGNFPNLATNPNAYFTLPTLAATGIPPTPGLQRNMFRGPRYHDFDFTFGKDFGLPSVKFLGEGAKLSIKANFYNLFNTLNLSPLGNQQFLGNITMNATTNTITSFTPNTGFGEAQGALGARVIEFQARFSF
jgi:Carboxypeptidase regulatory-like domain/TonB dependent receptor